MQIVIPMSGIGNRFKRAGFEVPKPLIEVDGKPIIEHVVNLFPNETDITFICNQEHLDTPQFRMAEILRQCSPSGRIVGITPHKLGPVHAVLQIASDLDEVRPVIVNYCDFTCHWDYQDFKAFVAESGCDGAIPCYTGFHPHMLGSSNYAYVKEHSGWISDIQEKQPFTDYPMGEYASSGTYYFANGALVREYFEKSVRDNLSLKGEYYVSLAYRPMLEENRSVAVYPVPYFMQWGTPEDLWEWQVFSKTFDKVKLAAKNPRPVQDGAVLVSAAGQGSRFLAEGFEQPKPLIPVSGRPMILQAIADLPKSNKTIVVLRKDLPDMDVVANELQREIPGIELVWLDGLTDGQVVSCLAASSLLDPTQPLTIGACDNGIIYDGNRFNDLMEDPHTDIIVWGYRGHTEAQRHPEMFGWLDLRGDEVAEVSVKKPLSNRVNDPIVVGAFTFKRAEAFISSANSLIARDGRVNGELYVDSCINDAIAMGLKVRVLECDSYLCWGTPTELKKYTYWQSCFHGWASHEYRLDADQDVPAAELASFKELCRLRPAVRPEPRL